MPEFAEYAASHAAGPALLDRLRPWVVVAMVMLVIAYGPTLTRLVVTGQFNAPGLRVW